MLGHCAGCVCRLCGDLKTACMRLSFSDDMRVRGVFYTRRAIQIDVLYLFLPLSDIGDIGG